MHKRSATEVKVESFSYRLLHTLVIVRYLMRSGVVTHCGALTRAAHPVI